MHQYQDQQLIDMARHVLKRNRYTERTQHASYTYTRPARGWYDQQWLWDSCFHAIALSTFDADAAKEELRSLMAGQRDDGFLPSVIMRNKPSALRNIIFSLLLFRKGISNITQPPVVALALERVYQATHDHAYLDDLLPKVIGFFAYLREHRDPEHSGLITIIHPWEAGIDSTPAFDGILGITSTKPGPARAYLSFYDLVLRDAWDKWNIDLILHSQRFAVKDVLFNCIYAQGLRAISRLCIEVKDVVNAQFYEQLADDTEAAIIKLCWNEQDGLFYDLSRGRQIHVPTISSLFPLILETLPRRHVRALVDHLQNPNEFWTPYPLSTVPLDSPDFNPVDSKRVLWRGPVWVNANWFMIKALRRHGYEVLAGELLDKTKAMMLRSDTLYEFYNPLTATGEGQKNFSWSALILDLL